MFGTPCSAFDVTVDLSRAADWLDGAVAVPPLPRYGDLLALSLQVALDGRHVRRVSYVSGDRTTTVSFWDVGLPLEPVDWTRLPRDPEDES